MEYYAHEVTSIFILYHYHSLSELLSTSKNKLHNITSQNPVAVFPISLRLIYFCGAYKTAMAA